MKKTLLVVAVLIAFGCASPTGPSPQPTPSFTPRVQSIIAGITEPSCPSAPPVLTVGQTDGRTDLTWTPTGGNGVYRVWLEVQQGNDFTPYDSMTVEGTRLEVRLPAGYYAAQVQLACGGDLSNSEKFGEHISTPEPRVDPTPEVPENPCVQRMNGGGCVPPCRSIRFHGDPCDYRR